MSKVCITFFAILCALEPRAEAKPANDERPYLIGAIGDSITAAFGSNWNGPSQPAPAETGQNQTQSGVIRVVENKRSLSWFSGQKVNSHAERLRRILGLRGEKIEVHNAAVSGAETNDIRSQVRSLTKKSTSKDSKGLLYLAMFIGSNDVCSGTTEQGTPDDLMAQNINNALSAVNALPQDYQTAVLVSSLPKIPDLGRPEITNARTFWGLSCGAVRDRFFRSCNRLVRWKTTSDYLRGVELVEKKNHLLEKIVIEARQRFTRLDLAYSDAAWREQLDATWLAFDCFHPNAVGQNILAERLWNDQPWFH